MSATMLIIPDSRAVVKEFFITAGLFQQTPPRPERSFPSKAGNRTTAWSENRRNLPVQFPSKAKRSPGWMTAYSGSGYERNVCDVSKSPLAALALWAVFCLRQKPKELASPLRPQIFSAAKKKTTRFWVAVLEQVTSETSVTFPSPLLLPLPYRQYFACGKNRGNLLRLSTPESFRRQKKKNHPIWMVLNWSRLRGSNSLPPPWQGGALPDELNLHTHHRNDVIFGASDRNRTNDTRIFSPLLYRLSYRGGWRPVSGSNRRPLA